MRAWLNNFFLLLQLDPFSENSEDEKDFLYILITGSRHCSDEDRLYLFGIFCGPACASWFECAKITAWKAACNAFKVGYNVWVRTKDAFL